MRMRCWQPCARAGWPARRWTCRRRSRFRPSSPLWDTPNLLLTPHCAGESGQTTAHELAIIQDNLARFLKSEPLINVVDVRSGY